MFFVSYEVENIGSPSIVNSELLWFFFFMGGKESGCISMSRHVNVFCVWNFLKQSHRRT